MDKFLKNYKIEQVRITLYDFTTKYQKDTVNSLINDIILVQNTFKIKIVSTWHHFNSKYFELRLYHCYIIFIKIELYYLNMILI